MRRVQDFENYSRSKRRRILIANRQNQNIDQDDSMDSSDPEEDIQIVGNDLVIDEYLNHDNNEAINNDNIEHFMEGNSNESEDSDSIDIDDEEDDQNDDFSEDEFFDAYEEESIHSENDSINSENDSTDSEMNFEENNDCMDGYEEIDEDPLLYAGAQIRVSESLLSILTLTLRFNVSGVLLDNILKLIELHCPIENNCVKTLYKFKKYFEDQRTPLNKHFYCGNCYRNLDNENERCLICENSTDQKYFITGSIISQLKALYNRPGFRNKLLHRFTKIKDVEDNVEDIYDGLIYKELCQPGEILSDMNNISYMWYTDGVPVFKSSKFSFWPVYLIINELAYEERFKKENLTLVGLWFGEEKPQPNLFLRPIHDEIIQLRNGVDVITPDNLNPINVKSIIVCGTCDLPAKALFLNMKQYNGKFGCHKCKSPGERMGNIQVYPYRKNLKLRTEEETRQHANMARNGQPVCGVKGPTIMSSIVHQWIRTTTIDPMHCIFVGLMRMFLTLWFDNAYADEDFSISYMVDIVDSMIKNFRPTENVQRLPRSIKDHIKHWKSSELKNFFFNYSLPILGNILPQPYFEHFKLLVAGIFLLSQKSISLQAINDAHRLLNEFVSRFENLYGRRYMSPNVHSVLHFPDIVKDIGPLFVFSCTGFEDINGKLKALVHGSKCAELQIFYGVSLYTSIFTLQEEITVEGSKAYTFCKKLLSPTKQKKLHYIGNASFIAGSISKKELPLSVSQAMVQHGIEGQKAWSFKKLFKNKIIYSSLAYTRTKKTNSTCAKYNFNDEDHHGIIKLFLRVTNCNCKNICQCPASHYVVLQHCQSEIAFPNLVLRGMKIPHIYTINIVEEVLEIVPVDALKTVCFIGQVENILFVAEPANTFEIE